MMAAGLLREGYPDLYRDTSEGFISQATTEEVKVSDQFRMDNYGCTDLLHIIKCLPTGKSSFLSTHNQLNVTKYG